MLGQLLVGTLVSMVSLIGAATVWWLLNEVILSMEPWLKRPPKPAKAFLVVLLVVLSMMVMMTSGVAIWAAAYLYLAIFSTWEEATYFSLVAYTTLGLGDIVIPKDHRLLGGMTGANGFLMFGLMTAILTDALRHIRRIQRNLRD